MGVEIRIEFTLLNLKHRLFTQVERLNGQLDIKMCTAERKEPGWGKKRRVISR